MEDVVYSTINETCWNIAKEKQGKIVKGPTVYSLSS